MALRQFDTKNLDSIIADNRESEAQRMEMIATKHLAEAIRAFTCSMLDYISELKSVASKQDAKKISDEISSAFKVAAKPVNALSKVNRNLKKIGEMMAYFPN